MPGCYLLRYAGNATSPNPLLRGEGKKPTTAKFALGITREVPISYRTREASRCSGNPASAARSCNVKPDPKGNAQIVIKKD
jgi:hypothetical protein